MVRFFYYFLLLIWHTVDIPHAFLTEIWRNWSEELLELLFSIVLFNLRYLYLIEANLGIRSYMWCACLLPWLIIGVFVVHLFSSLLALYYSLFCWSFCSLIHLNVLTENWVWFIVSCDWSVNFEPLYQIIRWWSLIKQVNWTPLELQRLLSLAFRN